MRSRITQRDFDENKGGQVRRTSKRISSFRFVYQEDASSEVTGGWQKFCFGSRERYDTFQESRPGRREGVTRVRGEEKGDEVVVTGRKSGRLFRITEEGGLPKSWEIRRVWPYNKRSINVHIEEARTESFEEERSVVTIRLVPRRYER